MFAFNYWVERFKAEKKPGLQNRSRKPHTSPNQMKPYWYYKIHLHHL